MPGVSNHIAIFFGVVRVSEFYGGVVVACFGGAGTAYYRREEQYFVAAGELAHPTADLGVVSALDVLCVAPFGNARGERRAFKAVGPH